MSYQPRKDCRAMITKLLRRFLASGWFQRPPGHFQPQCVWQSEFLFLPTKRPLRDDTESHAMTRPSIVSDIRKSEFHRL